MWEHTDSNRGPAACKAAALNQLSYAPENVLKNYPLCYGIAKIRAESFLQNFFEDFLENQSFQSTSSFTHSCLNGVLTRI